MANAYRVAALALAIVGPLAGCGTQALPRPEAGVEVYADEAAQIVNPTPNLDKPTPGMSGRRAADAYTRYATERVYPPVPSIETVHEGQSAPLPPPAPSDSGN